MQKLSQKQQQMIALALSNGKIAFIAMLQKIKSKYRKNRHQLSKSQNQTYNIYNLLQIHNESCFPTILLKTQQSINNILGNNRQKIMFDNQNKFKFKDLEKFDILKNKLFKILIKQQNQFYYSQFLQLQKQKYVKQFCNCKFRDVLQCHYLTDLIQELSFSHPRTKLVKVEVIHIKILQFYSNVLNYLTNHLLRSRMIKQWQQQIHNLKSLNDQINNNFKKHLFLIQKITSFCRIDLRNEQRQLWKSNFIEQQKSKIIAQNITGKQIYTIQQHCSLLRSERQKKHRQIAISIDLTKIVKKKGQQKSNHQKTKKYSTIGQKITSSYQSSQYNQKLITKMNTALTNNTIIHCSEIPNFRNKNKKLLQSSVNKNIYENFILKNSSSNIKQTNAMQLSNFTKIIIPQPQKDFINQRQQRNNQFNLERMNFSKVNHNLWNKQHLIQSKNFKSKEYGINNNVKNSQAKFQEYKYRKSSISSLYPYRTNICIVESSYECYLLYDLTKIDLKELSLRFIIDRYKFTTNNVKIRIPSKIQNLNQQKVFEAIKILNCLGAVISYQEQKQNLYYNQRDECMLMMISFLQKIPFAQVIGKYEKWLNNKKKKY